MIKLIRCNNAKEHLSIINNFQEKLYNYHVDNLNVKIRPNGSITTEFEFEMNNRNEIFDFILLEKDKAYIGIVVLEERQNGCYIYQLYIDDKNKGYGRYVINILKRAYKRLELSVFKINENAVNFYQRVGFRVIEDLGEKYKMEL